MGARTINQSIDGLIEKFNSEKIQLIWQTGKNYETINKPEFGFVSQFIEKMELVYAAADIIISRAGAIAITELCIVGKPVILVPSPNVAEDHQTKNAMALVDVNAALLVKDREAKTDLWMAIETLIKDKYLAEEFALNVKKLEKPQAAEAIVDEVFKLVSYRQ